MRKEKRTRTGDNWRGTPKTFVLTNFWGRKLAGPVLIVLLSLLIVVSYASALTYSNNIDLEYTYATTLDISLDTNIGFIIEDLAPGNASYSNTVTITASSNNSDGFTMSATAGNSSDVNRNNNRLVNNSDNTNYFDSIATNANIAELTNLGTNKWGYAIYDSDASTWSNYNGLPAIGNTGTPLVDMNKAGSTSVDMRIGASATNTQVSGMFTNNVNFTITAKVVTYDYIITYSANDGNPTSDGNNTVDTTNMPSNVIGSLETGDTLKVSNLTPARESYYTFLGWCDGTITGINCNGNLYQPSDYIKIASASSTSTNNINLAALWVIYMQDVNTTSMAILLPEVGSIITMYDKRDNQKYDIAKLDDQKYWMVSDLNLIGGTIIQCDNTDCENDYKIPNDQGWLSGNRLPYSSKSGFNNNNYAYIYNSGNITTDQANCNNNTPCNSYYSWDVATLGSGRNIATGNKNAPYSICPKGWRLPTTYNGNDSTTDYKNLAIAFGGSSNITNYGNSTNPTGATIQNKLFTQPYSFMKNGYYNSGALYYGGTHANYWSATSSDDNSRAYRLLTSPTGAQVFLANSTDRKDGRAVRCLIRN